MIFTNELTIDPDHHTSHAPVANETATLLGRRNNTSTTSTSRVSRFGSVGFLLAFVALFPSAFVFLLNRGTNFPTDVSNVEVQVAKAQRPSLSESSSDLLDVLSSPSLMSSSFHAAETYFTYDDFSGGKKGKPTFVVSYDDYQAQVLPTGGQTELGNLFLTKAKELQATIIVNVESDKVFDAINDYETKHGCKQEGKNGDHCLILLFEGKPSITDGGVELLTVSKVDANDNRVPIMDINPADPNGIMAGSDAILAEKYEQDSRRRAFLRNSDGKPLSDGILKQPKIMQMSRHVKGYCPVDTITKKKDPNCPDHKHTRAMDHVYQLTMEEHRHKSVIGKFRTRLFNGKLPGETIKIKAGQTLRIKFHNELNHQEDANGCKVDEKCQGAYCDVRNVYCEPDHTNIHLHGFWGSGEQPSDDIEMKIPPVGNPEMEDTHYSYESYFRPDHMPGTHWVHTHPHGASALQVGGGTAFALIVEDRPEDDTSIYRFPIPPEVRHANDVVLVVQNFDIPKLTDIARGTFSDKNDKRLGGKIQTDRVFHFEINPHIKNTTLFDNFRLVNGQYRPKLHIHPGEWQRFRVIYAGWGGGGTRNGDLNLKFSNHEYGDGRECETNLLAKDGMYLPGYPRALKTFPIPVAGRADIMVRCPSEGTYNVTHFDNNEILFTIISKGGHRASKDPSVDFFKNKTEANFPQYLMDPGNFTNPDCGCSTALTYNGTSFEHGINYVPYQPHQAVHSIKMNETISRDLEGIDFHPYHQHVYPFVIQKGLSQYNTDYDWSVDTFSGIPIDPTMGGYFLNDDWHDSLRTPYQPRVTIRFHPREILGKVMLHCHRLDHEDTGMMSQEYVSEAACSCDFKNMTHQETRDYSAYITKAVDKNPMT